MYVYTHTLYYIVHREPVLALGQHWAHEAVGAREPRAGPRNRDYYR